MTSGPGYYSNEELVRRLHDLARSSAQGGRMRGGGVRELRTLASTLADRIYDDPERWGIADISPEFRDDAAADILMRLLSGTADIPPRTQVTEWFGRAVEARFRQLWALAEEAREKRRDQAPVEDEPLSDEERESAANVLEENSEMWRRFESEFPHDAFMVRLRLRNEPPGGGHRRDAGRSERGGGDRADQSRARPVQDAVRAERAQPPGDGGHHGADGGGAGIMTQWPTRTIAAGRRAWERFAMEASERAMGFPIGPPAELNRFARYMRSLRYGAGISLRDLTDELSLPFEDLAMLEQGLLQPSEVPTATWVQLMRLLEGREVLTRQAMPQDLPADDDLWAVGDDPQGRAIQPFGVARIKVIGVGGGGSNAVNRMYRHRIEGVDYIAINTDAQHLIHLDVPEKIRIGDRLARGLGVGGGPQDGPRVR